MDIKKEQAARRQRTLSQDVEANAGVIMGLVGVSIGLLIMAIVFVIGPVVGYNVESSVSIPSDTFATGTFTFSGNVSNGELLNITDGTAVYRFEFNTTANGSAAVCRTANCIIVNLSETSGTQAAPNPNVYNNSLRASGNLTSAINANTSAAAIVTAANTTNLTTLTADATGTGANSIALADNAANVASAGMAGGVTGSRWDSATNTAITNGTELWQQNTPLLGSAAIVAIAAVIIGVLLGSMFMQRR